MEASDLSGTWRQVYSLPEDHTVAADVSPSIVDVEANIENCGQETEIPSPSSQTSCSHESSSSPVSTETVESRATTPSIAGSHDIRSDTALFSNTFKPIESSAHSFIRQSMAREDGLAKTCAEIFNFRVLSASYHHDEGKHLRAKAEELPLVYNAIVNIGAVHRRLVPASIADDHLPYPLVWDIKPKRFGDIFGELWDALGELGEDLTVDLAQQMVEEADLDLTSWCEIS